MNEVWGMVVVVQVGLPIGLKQGMISDMISEGSGGVRNTQWIIRGPFVLIASSYAC